MTTLILDTDLRNRLNNLTGLVELHDEEGRIVGYFSPLSGNGGMYEDLDIPVAEEEIERLRNQPRGRPLADILADLEKGQ
jgi:hypothetical protein